MGLRQRAIQAGVLLLAAMSLVSCTGLDQDFRSDPALEGRILTEGATPRPEVDLLATTPAMRRYVDRHVDPGQSDRAIVERLRTLLFDEAYLNLTYDETATLTAAEAFEQRRANCLALVNLYIAMARQLDLDVDYQTVDVRPRWDRQGAFLVVREHINALGQLGPRTRYIVDFTPEVRLRPGTAEVVDETRALARFFNNLGVESLLAEQPRQAVRHFQHALLVDPSLAIAWNNIGSAHNRLDNGEFAEYSYRRAYSLDRSNTTALNNLASYYAANGEEERARRFREAQERAHRDNPYFHYMRGSLALEEEAYESAREHFEEAIRRQDREPDFYYALGLTYRETGREEEADQLITAAAALREYGDQRYRASEKRLRVIEEEDSILRSSSAGMSFRIQ